MKDILQLLLEGEALDSSQLARILAIPQVEVDARLAVLKEKGIFLGWRAILNPAYEEDKYVRALIEVKVRPEGGLGYDSIAGRISRFEQVETCYLLSGAFDLLVIVKDVSLRKVASFVHERLARIEGVQSTATCFMLRTYKEQGCFIPNGTATTDKLAVSP
ncbi:MAG: Lrp/AsnC ligand binding domain-containing protein [Puniceicoccales bacterium]|jgi:DNA-binding Lrp family transcriptional regulator|nr:Lrp/AsnC ligand binding domain-containing protein [Puniceicoccales bacterium]